MTGELARAAELLAGATKVAMACHVNPDTDALGSMLGLSIYLRSRGIETVCSFGNEPFDLPRWAEGLPGREALVQPKEFPKEPAVMVTCDAASMNRLGSLAANATKAGALIWIDHRFSLKKFQVFALYCMGYTAARFVFEEMRIDPAHTIGPLRVNAWVSIVVFLAALGSFLWLGRRGRPVGAADSEATAA